MEPFQALDRDITADILWTKHESLSLPTKFPVGNVASEK